MPAKRSRHVLVVNDDDAILELFIELLGEEGYQVTTDRFEGNSRSLFESVKSLMPDMVILDFIIGGEAHGWQVL